MAVPADVLDRLRKLLGMLGSDYDGERAVAGRMASDLLRQHRLTWADVVGSEAQVVTTSRVRVWHEPKGHRESSAQCLAWPEILTDWEKEFLRSISGRWRLSGRQTHCLDRILIKCREFARASGATFT
jgi:hypothetical protein